jgi:hypothetical protein
MSMKITWIRATAVAGACAIGGAAAGIAGSAAAPSTTTKAAGSAATAKPGPPGPGHHLGRPGFGRGAVAVHAEVVVLNRAGDGYVTEAVDDGTVTSVSGNDIVIAEGTKAVPYKDVTVTVASGATIRRNGKAATLSDLKAGDTARVASSTDGTTVFAADDQFRPTWPGGRHRGDEHHGRRGAP